MNELLRHKYEVRAKVAKALAHPTRLYLVDLLHHQERSVGDLTALVAADQSTVSKHLATLQAAGLVSHRKEGTTNFYRVTCGCLDGFFACLENVLRSKLDRERAAIEDSCPCP